MEASNKATDANVASNAPAKVKAGINTSLVPETIGVSIHKIVLKERDGRKFYLMSCTNLQNGRSLTLSASEEMVEAFDIKHVIAAGNYNSEASRPLYHNVEVIYIPDDGVTYGYVNKDGIAVAYQLANRDGGNYIFRNIKEPIDGEMIRAIDAEKYAASYRSEAILIEARTIFKTMKGKPYVERVSVDDDKFFLDLYKMCKG